MFSHIVRFSLNNKLIIILFTLSIFSFGIYALTQIPIGAVPDVTNNQVQVITTSRNLSTEDIEQFITYPIELEMANLPGVKEIRSISKFGLSVVTIVFEDKMGTYLPRQLIAEKIKSASEKIPEGFGSPEMGPISTGLGEIYQYVLEVDEAHKGQYSSMELRTIQDWIVKRQLAGIPGVVEVNTWGGYLKRYEVSLDPEILNSMNISPVEILNALDKNNHVAGGGYIEKVNQSFFIRGEGLIKSLEDIENIVVTTRKGAPIYIKDVGTVGFGHATRFGAVTGNGEGEKVLGQVMMLKGANSKAVIEAVKQRVAAIQSTLPQGITINPFLERSELIGKTTFTIAENLTLGCLIVIFVVVLLLGNIRSGLVVASVIPLALLFAISLMYIFGIDANLMSLGAIDFGIIIDGAVIIVEFIAFKISASKGELGKMSKQQRAARLDQITFESTSRMMRSAVFGQLIIIIVFIPILSMTNIEGKMFIPMALTFCFALIGTMILCFTYVPVISSLLIKPDQTESSLSKRLLAALERMYVPALSWALLHKRLVLLLSIAVLGISAFVFSTIGGEFVPTLDEGDFVIQPVLKTGTSLSKTIETTTRIEQIIKRFPEVKQVVTRIGAAEVPTDPMSMEETDVIVTLKNKDEWVSASSKDELADKVKEALTREMPSIEFEFTQPIEMRFNELITGVRSDLAVKVFGENMDLLYEKALEIGELVKTVEGAADVSVEKVAGLPQLQVKYDRRKIAEYGLNISDINRIISLGFAGEVVGSIFEGERRFDLSVRFSEDHRKSIDDLANIYLTTPAGGKVPIREVASVSYTYGPAKISRDDTKRRVVVNINVRNRDLESVVQDVSRLVEQNIHLPPGYSVAYGGQFESLRSARKRLAVAVPVSLILIFIMLHFAFKSLKDAMMIYSAIPLAAVGGIWLLWIRDMPFSISAGVGFIALFGIAVLNGIVLIEHFKELKAKGINEVHERVIMGAKQRLRPVLLTASAAALGFLPMAVSTSAGAEVQRPLATVVVGGLITATLLTLIVLPILYTLFDKPATNQNTSKTGLIVTIVLILCALPSLSFGQQRHVGLQEVVAIAQANNKQLQAMQLEVEQYKKLVGTAYSFDKTTLYYNKDENNLTPRNLPLSVWGVQQSFDFPTTYGKQGRVFKDRASVMEHKYQQEYLAFTKEVTKAYYKVVYARSKIKLYKKLDNIYTKMHLAADRKFEIGESNRLEQLTAKSLAVDVSRRVEQTAKELEIAKSQLFALMQADEPYQISEDSMHLIAVSNPIISSHPAILQSRDLEQKTQDEYQLKKHQQLPGISLVYFQGNDGTLNAITYQGFQIGISIPLLFSGERAKIISAKLAWDRQKLLSVDQEIRLNSKLEVLKHQLDKHKATIDVFRESGKQLSDELLKAADKAFASGEINFMQYAQLMERATMVEVEYLDALWSYNETALEINYLTF